MKPVELRGHIIRLAVSAASIAFIIFMLRDKLDDALLILRRSVDWRLFAIAAVIYFIGLVIVTLRLQCVFRVQHVHLTFRETFYLGFVGLFFNLFLPSAVGGDVAKAYFAYKRTGKKIECMTSIVLDRLIGFVAMTLMAMTALWFFNKEVGDVHLTHLVYIFMGVVFLVALFFGSKRFASRFKFLLYCVPSQEFRDKLSDVYHALYGYKKHKAILVFSIVLSLIGQSVFVIMHYWTALSLGISLNLWLFFIIVPMISFVSMAPSVGGLGVREAGAIYLFSRFTTSERAIALSLLIDLLIYGYSFFSGVLFSLKGGLKVKTIHEMEALK